MQPTNVSRDSHICPNVQICIPRSANAENSKHMRKKMGIGKGRKCTYQPGLCLEFAKVIFKKMFFSQISAANSALISARLRTHAVAWVTAGYENKIKKSLAP